MSYNLVNPTTGALTKVSGNITSNIIPANASANNKLVTKNDIERIKAYTSLSNTDANTLTTTGLYYLTTGCTNIPSAYCILQVQSKNTTSISDDIAQYTINTEGDQYSRVRVNGTWSSWQKLATESDINSTTLTSTDSLASWAGNAKGVMTAFIGTSSKPSDIGAPLSSWGETMIWCIGHEIRKTLFAIDYSVAQQVIYTREYFNGSFISNWTPIKDGNLTSSVTSGSTAPITSGALYPVAIATPTPVSGVTGGDALIYGFKSGKMVTIVLNGIIIANNIMQNQSIFTNVPTAVGNKNIYFTVLDYENGKLAVMSIIGDSLAAAFQSDDQSAIHAGRYWGTVTYMTSD